MPIKNYNFKNYLWTIPFLSFLLGYFTIQQIFQPKSFNTPAIVGKKLQEAISILSKNQLNIKFISEKEDSDLPHGTILSQKPVPGLKITPNQSVYVTISKKPDRSACPEFFNKNISDITQTLKNKNLRSKSYYVPSNLPNNSCVAQYPSPENSVKDTCVITYISKGNRKPVIFPNFKNKYLPEVLEFLKNNHIKAEIIYTNKSGVQKQEATNPEPAQQEQNTKAQETQISPENQNIQTGTGQEAQNTKTTTQTAPDAQIIEQNNPEKTQEEQQAKNLQNAQVIQANQEVKQEISQEASDLTILDQRPLAGSLVNLDQSRPITVHLKVFKK